MVVYNVYNLTISWEEVVYSGLYPWLIFRWVIRSSCAAHEWLSFFSLHLSLFIVCQCDNDKNKINNIIFFTNTDSVVRTVYYKYFHPKEVLISNGVLNRWVLVYFQTFVIRAPKGHTQMFTKYIHVLVWMVWCLVSLEPIELSIIERCRDANHWRS